MSVNQIILPEIKFKNNLSKHNIVYSLIEQITEKIKKIPQYQKLRIEILINTSAPLLTDLRLELADTEMFFFFHTICSVHFFPL